MTDERAHAPEQFRTERLLLRRPRASDADAIYRRYAGDPAVGRYLAWPIHASIDDTRAFLSISDAEWERAPAGPYLIFTADGERLLGSTGLAFESDRKASTGYVLAKDAWGHGYATEAVTAMAAVAASVGVTKLSAACHPDHVASRRVLEKAGFRLESERELHVEFPNLMPGTLVDVACYALRPEQGIAADLTPFSDAGPSSG